MSNFVRHAEFELKKAGLLGPQAAYDGHLGEDVLKVVKIFAEQEHSGGSAAASVTILSKLLRFQTLSPLTSDPAEWMEVTDKMPGHPYGAWQSRRQPSTFSTDGGATWYDLDDPEKKNFPPHLLES